MSLFDEFLHEIDDIVDVVRRLQPDVGIVHGEPSHDLVDAGDHFFCVNVGGDPRLFRLGDDFVVHVGIISRVGHVVSLFL